jgi:hypothetical protein
MKKTFGYIYLFKIISLLFIGASIFGFTQLTNTLLSGILLMFYVFIILFAIGLWLLGNTIAKTGKK